MLAQIVTTALMMAYALVGFAVLHTLTLALTEPRALARLHLRHRLRVQLARAAMTALGLADAMFGFRERFLRNRPPPLPAS